MKADSTETEDSAGADSLHRLVRLSLWPLMAIFELALILLCWVLALCSPTACLRVANWATETLPDSSWYWSPNAPSDRMAGEDVGGPK